MTKYLQIFADVLWNVVASLGQSPPYLPARIPLQSPTNLTFSESRRNVIFSRDEININIQEAEPSEYKQANLREKWIVKGLQTDEVEKLISTFNFINEAGLSQDVVDTK